MHEATGLYAYGGWGKQKVDTDNLVTANELVEHDSQVWFLQMGIEQKWCWLGKTTVLGGYSRFKTPRAQTQARPSSLTLTSGQAEWSKS